jgi:hypothetical protein
MKGSMCEWVGVSENRERERERREERCGGV